MKAVLTRVSQASVTVDGEITGAISCEETGGILALIGVGEADEPQAWEKMADKIAHLRILEGEKSALDVTAPVLVVSLFTLMGATAKGRRPSWSAAAKGEVAEPIITKIVARLREYGLSVEEGRFGAMMKVSSINEGPFTVLVET